MKFKFKFNHNSGVIWALAFLLLATSGCATSFKQWRTNGFKVGPNYCTPGAETEMQWIDVSQDGRLSVDSPDVATWWLSFNDPVLNELIATAYDENLTLKQACTRIEQARAIRGIAVGNLAPQAQFATADYQRIQTSQNVAVPSPVRSFDDWGTGFNAAWELDIFGRFRRSVAAADAALDASIEDYDDVLVILFSDVAKTYVQIRTIQQRLELTRRNIESQQGSLDIAESRFKAKQTNKLDVNQAKNNIAFTESAIPALEGQLRLANNRLCVLLGMPPGDLVASLPPGMIPQVNDNLVVGIPADLLRRRPDIRRTERLLQVQSERIGIATADLYPRVTLLGSFEWQAQDLDDLLDSAALFGLIGPSVKWNIFNYGRIRNSIANERAIYSERVLQYQQQVLAAQQEVENSIALFLSAREQQAKVAAAVREVDEAEGIVKTLYKTGATDFNRVFTIESIRFSQQDQLVVAQANAVLSLIDTYRSLGGGWQWRCDSQSVPMQSASFEMEAEPLAVEDSNAEVIEVEQEPDAESKSADATDPPKPEADASLEKPETPDKPKAKDAVDDILDKPAGESLDDALNRALDKVKNPDKDK